MDKSFLSMKKTVSLDVEELVFGSSLEFVLMKMLMMSNFVHFFVITMIWEFQQSKGIKVHKPSPGSTEKRQYNPTEDVVEE